MKVNWGRELFTWAQYFCFSFVAATAGLLHQAAHNFDRHNDLDDGLISCFYYTEVLKDARVYYGWLLGIFLTLSAVRFSILLALSSSRVKLR